MVTNVLLCQKWNPEIGMRVTELEKLPLCVKLMNIPMEAWSVEGIRALASGIDTPIVMDNTTAHMCQYGNGRSDYARVLIEVDAKKEIKSVIKVQYTEKEQKVRGTQVYLKGLKAVEEIAAKKRSEENMQRTRRKESEEFTLV
ncbi:zinc knuckle CX2CX4HX4C containing protein [Tanacetum coccineum]